MDFGELAKAKVRRRRQVEETKAAMDVKALPGGGCYTHVGTVKLDGKVIRYYGKMVGGCFVFDPMARDVI